MDARSEAVLGRQGSGCTEVQICCLQGTPGLAFALEESVFHPNIYMDVPPLCVGVQPALGK